MSKKCEKLSAKIEITGFANEVEYLAHIGITFTNNRIANPLKYNNKHILVSDGAIKHLTTSGSQIQSERTVDIERCSRLNWIFDILNKNICKGCDKLWVWTVNHNGIKKVKIYCAAENYFIILEERADFCILLSAYKAWAHEAQHLKREYNRIKKCP